MKEITESGKMSKKEFLKSSRDATMVAVSTLIPTLLSFVESTNFGEWNYIVGIILAMIMPFLNRYFNIQRL